MRRYPKWKLDLFEHRERMLSCRCRQDEAGNWIELASCPLHGWEQDSIVAEGRSIIENDAIQAEMVYGHRRRSA